MRSLTLLSLFICQSLWASVQLTTEGRVEVLALNSTDTIVHVKPGEWQLPNGTNQLLVRVSGMIDTNGGKQKFNGLPLVVTFEAHDQAVTIAEPFVIRDQRGVERYKRAPSVHLHVNGQPLPYQSDEIYDQSFSLTKNYDEMLASYNELGYGKAQLRTSTLKSTATAATSPAPSDVVLEATPSLTDKEESRRTSRLQHDFLTLPASERQEFLSWAVKHLNHGL